MIRQRQRWICRRHQATDERRGCSFHMTRKFSQLKSTGMNPQESELRARLSKSICLFHQQLFICIFCLFEVWNKASIAPLSHCFRPSFTLLQLYSGVASPLPSSPSLKFSPLLPPTISCPFSLFFLLTSSLLCIPSPFSRPLLVPTLSQPRSPHTSSSPVPFLLCAPFFSRLSWHRGRKEAVAGPS